MIVIHHNKDMDGFCSGAICKLKYPDATLIGWDYKDDIPDFEQFKKEDVIMIDITFPLLKLVDLSRICNLTVIDHHISFRKEVIEYNINIGWVGFQYIYEDGIAACEIGWKYLFPGKELPPAVELISKYDTWRRFGTDEWYHKILPFQYYMRIVVNSAESFPLSILDYNEAGLNTFIKIGKSIVRYQELQNESACERSSFEKDVYGGLRAICLNARAFSSETLKSVYDPSKHDIMIGFEYTGTKWSVSLRSDKPEVNVSIIAKERGGGGHIAAAGFEVTSFDKIFN